MAIADRGQGNADTIASILAGHVGVPAWREVLLLTIAYLGLVQRLPTVAGQVLEALVVERPGPPGEAVVLCGEALVDIGETEVPPEHRRPVEAALVEVMQDAAIGKALRRRAGMALGLIGWRPADLDQFLPVAAGEFLYGEDKAVRRIEHGYWVAKYPVTNGQYRGFVEAGGYRQRRWWDEEGWERVQAEKLENPRYWHDANRNNPLSPVVEVNRWEARAYCRWLDVRLQESGFETRDGPVEMAPGHAVRLPSEQQWECAARGVDGREYPWGDVFDAVLANTGEEAIGTTAVCTYPGGVSPVGAWDMAGNVWEVTDSWQDESVVWRGGSWIDSLRRARCAARLRFQPEIWDVSWGFRVFVSLAPPES
jgi:formylglycine-generating enzyme required for sulfatase activity